MGVTTFVLQFVSNIKNKLNQETGPLTAAELHDAKMKIASNSYIIMKLPTCFLVHQLLPLVRQLCLFIDEEGFICVQNNQIPILTPSKTLTHITNHLQCSYSSVPCWNKQNIRQTFWIPKARQHIKSLLQSCITCKRHSGRPYTVLVPSPLPEMRMCDVVPFTVTGIDFAGALMNGAESKIYICCCVHYNKNCD